MSPAALLLDYALEAVNFVHLSLVVTAFDLVTFGLLLEKAGIAAVEHLDPAVFEQHRFCRHFVEKIAVMAYNYRAAAVVVDEVSSHSRLVRSIWFVGSSSSSKSGALKSSLPSASFDR